jgi:DNA-directed RNA polymerase specialized sigma24 family protein
MSTKAHDGTSSHTVTGSKERYRFSAEQTRKAIVAENEAERYRLTLRFERLYRCFHPSLVQHVRRLDPRLDSATAEDIAHDAWLALWRCIVARRVRTFCKAWLWKTTQNDVVDLAKKRLRRSRLERERALSRFASVGSPFAPILVKRILQLLGGPERQLLRLRYLEGHTPEETMHVLGLPRHTYWRLHMQAVRQAQRIFTTPTVAIANCGCSSSRTTTKVVSALGYPKRRR